MKELKRSTMKVSVMRSNHGLVIPRSAAKLLPPPNQVGSYSRLAVADGEAMICRNVLKQPHTSVLHTLRHLLAN